MGIHEHISKLFEIVNLLIKQLDKTNLQDKGSGTKELNLFLQKSRNEIQVLKESIRSDLQSTNLRILQVMLCFSLLYPDHEKGSDDITEDYVSQNDDHHDDDNIEDFLDLSISEGFFDQSDEKPKKEINRANVVTILFKKTEEPKIKNQKKSQEKKQANGQRGSLYECLICGRDRFIKMGEDVHDKVKESLFHCDQFNFMHKRKEISLNIF